MTQPTVVAGDVTLGEVARTLNSLRDEIRALRAEHVRADLYAAHKAATDAELRRIETDYRRDLERLTERFDGGEHDRTTYRRQVYVALAGAASSLLATLVSILVH